MTKSSYDLPYFPLYVADFITDTQDLYEGEVGAYLRILMYQWKNGGAFELKRAQRVVHNFDETWPILVKFFNQNDEGLFYNNRLEEERQKIVNRIKAGSKGGSKTPSKTPSKKGDNSELRTQNLDTHNSEEENPNPDEVSPVVLSLISEYKLIFPNLTIPRILDLNYSFYGLDALRHLLEAISGADPKLRYKVAYVKGIIKNAPLQGIKDGKNDEQGKEIQARTRDEAMKWSDSNGRRMDKSFTTRLDNEGNKETFEDGSVKFWLLPHLDAFSGSQGARA